VAEIRPITVVEAQRFLISARKIMDDAEREELVGHLAFHPSAGAVIPGTGGVRKLRWALEGRGKRGGARLIYFYYDDDMPLFLLDIYAKNERTDLTQRERNELRSATQLIVASHKTRKVST
jgi:hypothetical protein